MIAYREGGYTWKYSAAITVDARSWSSGAVEISVPIPADWDAFWTTINQTDARDVRVLSADGLTKLTYDIVKTGPAAIDAGAITSRDGRLRISGWTPPLAAMCRLVVVWGQSSVSSGAGSPTFASPINGYIALGLPARGWMAMPPQAGRTKPVAKFAKGATEQIVLGLDVGGLVDTRATAHARSRSLGAISYASYVVHAAGTPQGGMVDASTLRFIDETRCYFLVNAGSSGTTYTIVPTVVLTSSQTLIPRALLEVRDLTE